MQAAAFAKLSQPLEIPAGFDELENKNCRRSERHCAGKAPGVAHWDAAIVPVAIGSPAPAAPAAAASALPLTICCSASGIMRTHLHSSRVRTS